MFDIYDVKTNFQIKISRYNAIGMKSDLLHSLFLAQAIVISIILVAI